MLKRAAVALTALATMTLGVPAAEAAPATAAAPAAAPAALAAATTPSPLGMTQWGGADLYATAILTSQKTFQPGVDEVVVSTGAGFQDGLAGAAVAANANGPVLLTAANTLRADIRAELQRLNPGSVLITGGTGAISPTVEAQIRAAVPNAYVSRAGGPSLYDTAAMISSGYYVDGAQTAYIASATSAADATTAASPAGLSAGPLLLTGSTLPTATRNELVRLKNKGILETVVIVGGPGAVPDAVFSAVDSIMGKDSAGYPRTVRVWGPTLYDTSVAMARLLWDGSASNPAATTVFYTNGTRWGDALAAGPAAAANDAPVIHTTMSCMPGPVKTWDNQNAGTIKSRVFVGGPAVIKPSTTAC